jgi:hypothetical protein
MERAPRHAPATKKVPAPAPATKMRDNVDHVAGVEDYQLALATFLAACQRWPDTPITLRQGARVIEDSRRLRMA